jgi:hypothetical protein
MATAERSEIDALRRAARNRKGLGNGRALDKLTLIQIDFRKERLAVMLDADEVVLTPRVVVIVERFESLDRLDDRISHRVFKCGHPGRHHDAAAPKGLPERIIQGAYLCPSRVPIFAFSIIVTHCYLRRVTGEPFTRRRTRPRLPCQCIAAIPHRPDRSRRGATGRDTKRRREMGCRVGVS